MGGLKLNEKRAKNAVLLLWIVLGVEIISIISSLLQLNLLQNALGTNGVSDADVSMNDRRQQLIAVVYMISLMLSGIAFILWFRRAYYNLHVLSKKLNYKEGWAAGSWFVPILNLFRPYQIMQELYHETRLILLRNKISFNPSFTSKYLSWWWGLFILVGYVGRSLQRDPNSIESIEEYITLTVVSVVFGVIGVILTLITIKVLKDYAEVEPLLVEVQKKRMEESQKQ